MHIRRFWLSLFLSTLWFAEFSNGQVNPGAPSFGAYDQHEYDTVNLQNLNVLLSMPMYSKAGAFPLRATLGGAAPFVYLGGTGGKTITPAIAQTFSFTAQSPFTVNVNGVLGPYFATQASPSSATVVTCPSGDGTGSAYKYSGWYVQLADGTQHFLPSTDASYAPYNGSNCSGGFTDVTIDRSGFTLSVTGLTVNSIYTLGGTLLNPYCSQGGFSAECVTDSNGNTISWSASSDEWIDTLGLVALTAQSGSSWAWFDVNGNNPGVSVTYGSQTLATNYGCTGLTDYPATANPLPTSVSFPDTTTFGMTWETNGSDYTGRIASFTNRATGTVSYNYNPNSLSNAGLNCTYLTPNTLTRTTADGKTTYSVSYAQISGAQYGSTTVVTDQGHNQTVYSFTGLTSTGTAAPPTVQALTQVQHYQGGCPTTTAGCNGGGTILITDVYCYNAASGQPGNCATALVRMPITEIDVYHSIYNTAGTASVTSRTETQYDAYGNVTFLEQYDFAPGTATRATTITYYQSGTSCGALSSGSHINNKACEVSTTLNGNKVADAKYTYDQYGNLLKTSVWNGSSWIGQTNSNSYNTNGTVSTSYDLANNQTSYAYNGIGGCNNLLPTSISKGGLTAYSTWNCTGAVKVSDTDANSNVTNYCYTTGANCTGGTADPFWRPLNATDPLGNVLNKTYPTGSSPNTINSSFTFNSNNSIQNTTGTIDGYGRATNVQKANAPSPSSYDTVSTYYTWSSNYRKVQTPPPCSTSLGSECSVGGFNPPVTSTLIDPLGRPYTITNPDQAVVTNSYDENDVTTVLSPAPANEDVKQVQKQYDGLGRLQFSCAIGNFSYSSTCSQNTGSASGVTTSYSYSSPAQGSTKTTVTRGTQSHIYTYDAMGRLTQKQTPEGGTWHYYYDTSSCSGTTSSSGNLVCQTDANGNQVIYTYDSLNRLTDVGAGVGGSTACRRFRYDNTSGVLGSLPSGVTLSNQYGRMVEAETDDCTWPVTAAHQITDEWFAYDKDGHMTDMWEETPNSGQYYHSEATFYGNGAVNTFTLANPAYYSLTYGLDGEGRWNIATEGTSQKIVTGTTYNAASQPTQILLTGTGPDQDNYTYDKAGFMTGFSFQVGNTPATMSGTLTWNPNGTLKNLAITDGFNSGGTQTCYYNPSSGTGMGYDDWGRLLNVSCGTSGSIWNQTFTYDQYNNLTKNSSGPGIVFNPTYNSSNNQYGSSFGATYDSNGDLTYDTIHHYAWNEFSKMKSVDISGTNCATSGECIVYDAFGRAVEIDKGSTYTEIWYTQLGKTSYMAGSTLNYSYWPAPGGGTGVATGNCDPSCTINYIHKDWLGNGRIVSTINNHAVTSDMAFAPYGEIYDLFGTNSTKNQMFTGDTQDIVSGLMDTPNREYSNASQGRWISPDPAGASWNAYAYATNPNIAVDPTGMNLFGGCDLADPCAGGGGGGGGGDNDPLDSGWGMDTGGFDSQGDWLDSGSVDLGTYTGTVDGASYDVELIQGPNGNYWINNNTGDAISADSAQELGLSTPSGLSGLLNFQPQMPVWGLNGSAAAGCTGPGIPCKMSQTALGRAGWNPLLTRFQYTIWDVNNNPVTNVTSVQEYFSDGTGVLPDAGTWTSTNPDGSDPNMYANNVVNGQFIDNVASVGVSGYTATQSFSASVGGVDYVISTTSTLSSVWYFGNYNGATSTTKNAYNPP